MRAPALLQVPTKALALRVAIVSRTFGHCVVLKGLGSLGSSAGQDWDRRLLASDTRPRKIPEEP